MLLSELAGHIGATLEGARETRIRGLAPIDRAGPDEVTFLANAKYRKHMSSTRAAAVIVSKDYQGPGQRLLRCDDPYFAFRTAMVRVYGFRTHPFQGVDETARVDPTSQLGADVRLGPNVYVGPEVTIGEGTVIYPNVFIGPHCRIGNDCILYPSVTLYDHSVLGDRVTVHAGSSIGHDGFGYATHAGRHEKIPQVGWVELQDDVEIGACCAIDRAALGPTVVGQGTKFSNLVAIGHGTQIGRHGLLVAQTGIAGSVQVGDYCIFGGQSAAAGHLSIGDHSHIGGRGGVTHSLPGGEQYWGLPAVPLTQAKRMQVAQTHLPEMRKQIKQLQREVRELRSRLEPRDR
jgi:UDP-3-O-[3-hydroxymyristoyl] glucosamine N-acyltransferase